MSARYSRIVDLAVSLALLVASGAVVWNMTSADARPTSSAMPQLPAEPLSLKDVATKGPDAAPIVMVVFSDFQCPFCGKFALDVMPALEATYVTSGRLQIGFRHFPIQRSHPFASKAAQAAECARPQRFWNMHDSLFRLGSSITDSTLMAAAQESRLDPAVFSDCLQNQLTAERVQADVELARRLGIASTPTFYFGPRTGGAVKVVQQIIGNKNRDEFVKVIDSLLR